MIRKLVERNGILQAEPDFKYGVEKDEVLFYNFGRTTRMNYLKAGEEWDMKTISPVIEIGKKDRNGKDMFFQYVLPIRRIEYWEYDYNSFVLYSGSVAIRNIKAIKKIKNYYVDKSIVQELGKWVNPETKEDTVMCKSMSNEDIDKLSKDIIEKINNARASKEEVFIEV